MGTGCVYFRDVFDENDPIDVLDVTISSRLILDELLGIKDLRRDKRIDFVGGLRGLEELKRRCDSGEMKWRWHCIRCLCNKSWI